LKELRGTFMETLRQRMATLLEEGGRTVRELSQALHLSEREVAAHLPHVARTAAGQGKRLVIHPFRCLVCGYVFKDRKRLSRPGRCPRCKQGHLEEPRYQIR
jgi:hypothetical protein